MMMNLGEKMTEDECHSLVNVSELLENWLSTFCRKLILTAMVKSIMKNFVI